MEIKMIMLRPVVAALVAVAGFSYSAFAAERSEVLKMDNASVELYGHVLDMGSVYRLHGAYTWDDLKDRIPEVLPESATNAMSAAELCDHISDLHKLYLKDNSIMFNSLAEDLEKYKSSSSEITEADGLHPHFYAVSSRLYSSSKKGVSELFKAFPDDQSVRLITAQSSAMSELLVSYVHDAALANCADHAKSKGYSPVRVLPSEENSPRP